MPADIATDVIAAQFAGGLSIARLAQDWELDEAAVEMAVRHELRKLIPRWAGGLKPTRDEMRKQRRAQEQGAGEQPSLIDI